MIIIILLLLVTAIGVGINYLPPRGDVRETTVSNKVQTYNEYLLKSAITPQELYKIFSRYYKDVIVAEKSKQVSKNSLIQILNIKFKTLNQKGINTFIIKNTLTLLTEAELQRKEVSKLVKEYINGRGIKFKVKENRKFAPVISEPANVADKFNLAEKVKTYLSPATIEVEHNPFSTLDALGYLTNTDMYIYITTTISSPIQKEDNNLTTLTKLAEIKANILKAQLEKIREDNRLSN